MLTSAFKAITCTSGVDYLLNVLSHHKLYDLDQ